MTEIIFSFENYSVTTHTSRSIKDIVDKAVELVKSKWREAKAQYVSGLLAHRWPKYPYINLVLEIYNIVPTDYLTDINKKQTLVLQEGDVRLSFGGYLQKWGPTFMEFIVLELTDESTKNYTKFEVLDGEISLLGTHDDTQTA